MMELRPYVLLIPLIAGLAILLNLIHQDNYKFSPQTKSSTLKNNCDSLLKSGRYLDDVSYMPKGWQPDGCVIKDYVSFNASNMGACFKPGDRILITGDSTARQVLWGFTNVLTGITQEVFSPKHQITLNVDNVTVYFQWDPYIKEKGLKMISDAANREPPQPDPKAKDNSITQDLTYSPKTYLILTSGLWYVQHKIPDYKQQMEKIFALIDGAKENNFEQVYFLRPLIPHFVMLDEEHARELTPLDISNVTNTTDLLFNYNTKTRSGGVRYKTTPGHEHEISTYYVPVVNDFSSENHPWQRDEFGVHLTEPGFRLEASLLLNHICNAKISRAQNEIPGGVTCCIDYSHNSQQPFWKNILFMVIAFGLFFTIGRIGGSINKLAIAEFFVIGLVAGIAFLTNQTHIVTKIAIQYNQAEFIVFLYVWVIFTLVSGIHGTPHNDTNRAEKLFVREWKGICASLLILFRYAGYDLLPQSMAGEIFVRVLLTTWVMLEVYLYSLEYHESEESHQESLKTWGRAVSHAAVLPLLLGAAGVSKTFENSSPGTITYTLLPIELIYWYTFISLVDRLATKTGRLKSAWRWNQSLFEIVFIIIVAIISRLIVQIGKNKDNWGDLDLLLKDYWVVLFAILIPRIRKIFPIKEPIPYLHFYAGFGLITVITLVFFKFNFDFPGQPSDSHYRHPFNSIDVVQNAKYFIVREKTYTSFTHFFIVISTGLCYGVLRFGLLSSTDFRFSWWASKTAQFSYEALELHPYILLASSGSVILEYLPTGIETSLQNIKVLNPWLSDWVFPYMWWNFQEKVRKSVAFTIAFGMFAIVSWVAAEVWKNKKVYNESEKV